MPRALAPCPPDDPAEVAREARTMRAVSLLAGGWHLGDPWPWRAGSRQRRAPSATACLSVWLATQRPARQAGVAVACTLPLQRRDSPSRCCRQRQAAARQSDSTRVGHCTGRGEETILGLPRNEPACAHWCQSRGAPAAEVVSRRSSGRGARPHSKVSQQLTRACMDVLSLPSRG
jgi:hypothetical protein